MMGGHMGQITFKDMLMFVFLSTLIRKTAANQGRCIIQSIYCIQEIWVRAFGRFYPIILSITIEV